MWPRVVEILAGIWLLATPTVLGAAPGPGRWVPWVGGAFVVALSGSTFASRFRIAHLGSLAVGVGVALFGWLQTPRPGPGWAQSLILTGLVIALMAVVPTEATRPPPGWRRWTEEAEEG